MPSEEGSVIRQARPVRAYVDAMLPLRGVPDPHPVTVQNLSMLWLQCRLAGERCKSPYLVLSCEVRRKMVFC